MRNTALFLLGFIGGCCACKPPNPLPPEPDVVMVDTCDGSCPDAASDIYDQACLVLSRLGCPEAATTSGGTTCHDAIKKFSSEGNLGIHADCISQARSLSAVRACNVRCSQ